MSSLPAPASRRLQSSSSPPSLAEEARHGSEARSCDNKAALNPLAPTFVPSGDGAASPTAPLANDVAKRGSSSRWVKKGHHPVEHRDTKQPQQLPKRAANIRYEAISRPAPRASLQRRQYRRNVFNKDLFLQANFRFLVSDLGDYGDNATDPDKMLDWEDIAMVELLTVTPVQCPICLDEQPLCPQITSCGHIFCFPCILRYMLMDEGSIHRTDHWKKCPLCFAMTSCKELRSVFLHQVKRYKVGDQIEFTLLARAKDSVIPLQDHEPFFALPFSEDGHCDLFSKFTLTSHIEKTTDKAIEELQSWADAAQFGGPEELERMAYVAASIEQLKARKAAWDEHRTAEFHSSSPPVKQKILARAKAGISRLPNVEEHDADCKPKALNPKKKGQQHEPTEPAVNSSQQDGPKCRVNPFNDELELVDDAPGDAEPAEQPLAQEQLVIESYTFYQAVDGQLIVLHPLNMKCITRHYRSYKNLLPGFRAKICEVETFTQTEGTRRRYPHLRHLPLTSVIQLCEVDLSGVLPPSALEPFAEELRAREKRRNRKLQREKQVKREERRTEAVVKPPSPEDFVAIMSALHSETVPTDADFSNELSQVPCPAAAAPVEERKLFSSVTKLGFASGHDAPQLVTGASSSASNTSNAPVTKTGWGGPSSFVSVISKAKEPQVAAAAAAAAAAASSSSGKKGKKQSQVLLSTAGSGRRY